MSDEGAVEVPDSAARPLRRWLLPAAVFGAVLVIVGGVAMAWPEAERPQRARPAAEAAAVPAATEEAALATPPPVPNDSAAPARSSFRTGSSSQRPVPARSTGTPTRRASATGTSPAPRCTPAGVVDVVQVLTYGVAKVAARTDGTSVNQLCPGERIRVFWATYRPTADGGATLYRSEVRYLDHSSPTWTMRLELPDECGRSWYIGAGNWAIPQTLKPGQVPFGSGKLNWDTGGSC